MKIRAHLMSIAAAAFLFQGCFHVEKKVTAPTQPITTEVPAKVPVLSSIPAYFTKDKSGEWIFVAKGKDKYHINPAFIKAGTIIQKGEDDCGLIFAILDNTTCDPIIHQANMPYEVVKQFIYDPCEPVKKRNRGRVGKIIAQTPPEQTPPAPRQPKVVDIDHNDGLGDVTYVVQQNTGKFQIVGAIIGVAGGMLINHLINGGSSGGGNHVVVTPNDPPKKLDPIVIPPSGNGGRVGRGR